MKKGKKEVKKEIKKEKRKHPFLVALVSAAAFFIVYSAIRVFIEKNYNTAESLIFSSIVFLLIFFLQAVINKRIEE